MVTPVAEQSRVVSEQSLTPRSEISQPTAEQRENNQKEGVEERGDKDGRAEGSNGLSEGDTEHLRDQDENELNTGTRALVLSLSFSAFVS
jgi:hypothetical protein